MTQKYIYEQDPGHGWLGVPVAELVTLGCAGGVSDYSYWDSARAIVWLEEDCDIAHFLRAKLRTELAAAREFVPIDRSPEQQRRAVFEKFFTEHVQDKHVEQTRIRSLPSYRVVRDVYALQSRRAV
jgi:hypothetical protein